MGACVCKDRNAEPPIAQTEESDFSTHSSSHRHRDVNGHQNIASLSDQPDQRSGHRHRSQSSQVGFSCYYIFIFISCLFFFTVISHELIKITFRLFFS